MLTYLLELPETGDLLLKCALRNLKGEISSGGLALRSVIGIVITARPVESSGGVAEIRVAHDVVPREHARRFLSRQSHRDAFGNAGADESTNRGASQVVGDTARTRRCATRCRC